MNSDEQYDHDEDMRYVDEVLDRTHALLEQVLLRSPHIARRMHFVIVTVDRSTPTTEVRTVSATDDPDRDVISRTVASAVTAALALTHKASTRKN